MAAKPNVAAWSGRSRCVWRGWVLALLTVPALAPACVAAARPVLESPQVVREGRAVAVPLAGPLLRLRAGDRDLRLRLRQPGAPPRRHRFWLQGHDPAWVEVPSSGERLYQVLAPGSFRLRAAVADGNGRWIEMRPVGVLVQSPWWQSQFATAAGGLGALGVLGWLALAHRSRLRRRHEWQLAQSRQQLAEQHSEAKSRFLATLGHEIRTPMTGVLGMAELLQGSALDARQRGQVEAIQRAGRHLLRLVNDALDLARIEAGKLSLEDAPFELRPLLAEVARLLQPLASAKGLHFSLECDAAVPAALRGDATRVRQILFNLGHNAIKFCERGGVAVQVAWQDPEGLFLRVRDSGPGLSAGQQARLFRRFEQGDATEPGRYGGSGLGLAICQELAAAMGGSIGLHSEPGRGAEFRVELPLPAVALPASGAPAAPLPWPREAAPLRLLLVEDDEVVAEVVLGLLQRAGHVVVHAPHGLAALSELECGRFDLALLDLDLPGIDGMGLARLLRARGLAIPLLALTARADADAEPGALAAGMNGFLRKPVTGELLAAAIAGVVREAA